MSIIKINNGSYTTNLPPGEAGVTDYQNIAISPLVTTDFNSAIPTNSWFSSIDYPFFGDTYSSVMHAHPISMKATEDGLSLGYASSPNFIYDQSGTLVKYEFTFSQDPQAQIYGDLNISLDGMNATQTLLADASDWFVKAQWQDSDSNSQLNMTMGRGSPFVYVERTVGSQDVVISLNSQSQNSIGQPDAKTNTTFEMNHLNGTFNGGELSMNLLVNAIAGDLSGSEIGNAVQARISIDQNGDGKVDFAKTINFMPLDADANSTENYLATEGRGIGGNIVGQLGNLTDGSIRVEVWQSFGDGNITLKTGDASSIILPFDHLTKTDGTTLSNKLYLDNDGNQNTLVSTPQAGETIMLGDTGGENVVPWNGPGTIWYYDGNVAGLTINGNHYGIFAPEGSTIDLSNGELRSDLGGHDYMSVALLPDDTAETIAYFHQHAYAFVTDSTATYDYDESTGKVITDFTLSTDLKEAGFSDIPLTSLYRHQYINSDAQLTDYGYETARGEVKVFEGKNFSTELDSTGILPTLPNFLGAEKTQMIYDLLNSEYQRDLSNPILVPGEDSYFAGKTIGKFSELAQIADQVDHEDAKVFYLNAVKAEIEDWFTATGEADDKQFYYNSQWDTFQAYPASFESDKQLNDHHFHYGYFLKGAATIAQFDTNWAQQWGGMVNLMIQDIANTDRTDSAFPYLRNFDPYVGHSYASGHGAFAAGNNQESSSEALNFASSLMMWGAQIGNSDYQALGSYLYNTELSAIQQYWFDIDNAVFPDGYDHSTVGMVWDDGGAYATFFSGAAEMIHAINYLPMSGASLYLGLNPDYVRENFQELINKNAEQTGSDTPNEWMNLVWQYQAFFDPESAVNNFNAGFGSLNEPTFEQGDTLVHGNYWVNNFAALGQVDRDVTANTPFFTVFNNNGLLTYSAYNPSDISVIVTFSDGTQMMLQSEEFKAVNDYQEWSSVTGLVISDTTQTTDPTPTPDPVVEPDPVPTPEPDPTPEPTSQDIIGTLTSDVLIGTANDDVIQGLAGDDTIHADAGNDYVLAGDGNDTIHGITGDDKLLGGNGNDTIYGNDGNDILQGDVGHDFLVGGAGNDVFRYTKLTDSTTPNTDLIQDFTQGFDKIDVSQLQTDFNQLTFNYGNGYTFVGIAGTEFSIKLDGIFDLQLTDFILSDNPVVIDPTPEPTPDPTPNPDSIIDPIPTAEAITGTDANDVLIGTANADMLYGYGGDDTFHADAGDDIIYGGAGNDTIHGITGNDQLHGGDGNDNLYGNDGDDILQGDLGADFLVGGAGNDIYKYTAIGDSTTMQTDFIQDFEQGHDQIDLGSLNISYADITVNQLAGMTYVDVLGTDFSLKIEGEFDLKASDFGFDNTTSDPSPQPELTPTPKPEEEINTIIGTDNGEFLSGTLSADHIQGNSGDDQIHGLDGNDTLFGGAGSDSIYGNAGDDQLYGGAGADFIVGGDGADTYVYQLMSDSTTSQSDTIEGFQSGIDKLDWTALNTSADNVNFSSQNGVITASIENSDFSIDLIASDQINTDDILF